MNNRKKLSEDEKKIRRAIIVALRADELINEEILREEAEKRRLAREKRLAEEEEARRLREEAEAKRLAEEEARRLAEEEALRLAKEAAMREVAVRYRRSFMSRYIQAEPYIQDYYTEIKNLLLSYKGVKAKTAWAKENFKRGRTHIAKIDVKGKALCLYLAIDPKTLEGTKYNVSEVKGECPTLLKVKSERKKKYAIELISMLMGELGLTKISREYEDYRLAYEDNDALIERGLIKVILPKGEIIDENTVMVKADLSELEVKKQTETTDGDKAPSSVEESCDSDIIAASVQIAEHAEPFEEQISEESEDVKVQLNEEAEEQLTEEEIISIVDNGISEIEEIKDIISLSAIERPAIRLYPFATPLVFRKERAPSRPAYVFSGEGDANSVFTIPYTRKQYLALPRKKKKSVLMNVNAILRYNSTLKLLERLRSLKSENPRIRERIEILEKRLKSERRFLPNANLWADAVKRVIK